MKESSYFYTAMYLRLSKDDKAVLDDDNLGEAADKNGKSKVESNSIGSQREMIRSFLQEQANMELYDSYVDDGFSGSNYDRPEFKRMMSDIEAGRVNCVIVKDDCVIIERKHRKPQKMRVLWCPFCFLTQNRG